MAAARRIGAGALKRPGRTGATEWPQLTDVWLRFASPPIRQAGTMGGNIANGSPIGDGAGLMALDASRRAAPARTSARDAAADFYRPDYMKNRLRRANSSRRAWCRCAAKPQVRAYKISKRFDCDISASVPRLSVTLDGERSRAPFAFGGMAATVTPPRRAEGAVPEGHAWTKPPPAPR